MGDVIIVKSWLIGYVVYSLVNESSPATKEEGKMYSYIIDFHFNSCSLEGEDPNIPIYAYVIAGVIIIIIVGLLVGGITFYRKYSQKQAGEEVGEQFITKYIYIYTTSLCYMTSNGTYLIDRW